jgi:hypothetical protein
VQQPDDDFDNTPATQDKDAPKPAEQGTPGTKSVLTPAKDSIPTARVAQVQPGEPGDPNADPGDTQDQIMSSALRPERDPEKAWQDHALAAINGLYPRLRTDVDFAIGRRSFDSDVELLSTGPDVNIDWGQVEEAARRIADSDPDLNPDLRGRSLSPGYAPGAEHGEVPYRGRGSMNRENVPQEITPSEVNPRTNEKIPTQPAGAKQPRPFTQPTPPPDPNADKVTRR